MGLWEADTPAAIGCQHCGAWERDSFADLNRYLPPEHPSEMRQKWPSICIRTSTWVWCSRVGRYIVDGI